jgi:hypothetical protein
MIIIFGERNDMRYSVLQKWSFAGGGGECLASRAQFIIRPTVFGGHSLFVSENFQLLIMEWFFYCKFCRNYTGGRLNFHSVQLMNVNLRCPSYGSNQGYTEGLYLYAVSKTVTRGLEFVERIMLCLCLPLTGEVTPGPAMIWGANRSITPFPTSTLVRGEYSALSHLPLYPLRQSYPHPLSR